MVLRVSLTLVLASVLYQIISAERSTLKRDFYLSFAKVTRFGSVYFKITLHLKICRGLGKTSNMIEKAVGWDGQVSGILLFR